jgi:hypothetical protein
MTPFERHGIKHLSSSSITLWAADPAYWLAKYRLGHKSASNAAMERGKAVEIGIVHRLIGMNEKDALFDALRVYDDACMWGLNGDVDGERVYIGSMIDQGFAALQTFGTPDLPDEGQHKVSIDIDFGPNGEHRVPIIGYIDLDFPECVIDIKSTNRIPSAMSTAHRIQSAIYARSTNKPVRFLYVSSKKTAMLEDPDTLETQKTVHGLVRNMAAFLSLSDDPEILKLACPVNPDSFYWRGEEKERKALYGI